MKHRREIDGLRALAILPVLLFHAGFSWMPGGFYGVDVFFVISGFLITGIIVSELHKTQRFSIVGFYERRARRIIPALFLVMVVTTLAACFILFPNQWVTFLGSLTSITYFGSNYYFLGKSGYFDPEIDLNPMLHTWSLAIEEQFYLLFPLILWLLWKFIRERYWIAILTAIALGSLVWANDAATQNPDSAFYLLQFRAWELVAGSLAAIYISRRSRPFSSNTLSVIGLLMIVLSMFFIGSTLPHPGFITLVPVIGTVLILTTAGPGTFANKILSLRFFVGIGLISYSAYLWHQPLFALFRVSSPSEPSAGEFLPLIFVTLALSFLSWKFVENPFRNRSSFSRRKIFAGTAILIIGTLAINWVGTRQTFQDSRITVTGQRFGDVEDRLARNYGLSQDCDGFEPQAPECAFGTDPSVLLWGDSYARQLGLALSNSPTRVPFIQQTLSGCAPILGLASQSERNGAEFAKECIAFNDNVFNWLKKNPQIKYVILGSPWTAAVPEQRSAERDYVSKKTANVGYSLMQETFEKIRELGVAVVATTGTPVNGEDGGRCISATLASGGDLNDCNWPLADNQRAEFNESLKRFDALVPFWHWEPILCPDGITCHVTEGEQLFVYLDQGHITREATIAFGKKFDIMGQMIKLADAGPTR